MRFGKRAELGDFSSRAWDVFWQDYGGQDDESQFVFLSFLTLIVLSTLEVKLQEYGYCDWNVATVTGTLPAMEPERLGHISLGQENPRMWMNAAPG